VKCALLSSGISRNKSREKIPLLCKKAALLLGGVRALKNLVIFTLLKKTMDFFEVTGGRVLSFRNVSMGEPAGPDLSGQCGGGKTPPWIRC
jgi:hypothetical protein